MKKYDLLSFALWVAMAGYCFNNVVRNHATLMEAPAVYPFLIMVIALAMSVMKYFRLTTPPAAEPTPTAQ